MATTKRKRIPYKTIEDKIIENIQLLHGCNNSEAWAIHNERILFGNVA